MIELKNLLEEDEVIVRYHLHNEYFSRNCITKKGNTDISSALEMTLHRILESGGTEEDVYRIMGAKIPTKDELAELEEFDEFIWIDLGYVLPGLIDFFLKKRRVNNMTIENLKDRVMEIIKGSCYVNEDGGIEIYTDYRDRDLSNRTIKEIMDSNNPREAFDEMINDWAMDYAIDYGEDELEKNIREKLTDEEEDLFTENFDEIWEMVRENTYFYYDGNDFNNDVCVNIMVDCGNWNYDCTCDNVLNWYGNSGDGNIPAESSMLWLAKTQGKATKLRTACKKQHRNDGYYVDREKEMDKFIESCVQEFENLPSHMGTVTFLVKMNLFQLFDLIELQNKEYDEKGKYDPRKNEKSKSYIIIGKETMCGLYDSWNGSGSVLEIELDKDVKLPIKYCVFCVDECKMHGYDVGEVYGLCSSAWRDTLKEIKEVV